MLTNVNICWCRVEFWWHYCIIAKSSSHCLHRRSDKCDGDFCSV